MNEATEPEQAVQVEETAGSQVGAGAAPEPEPTVVPFEPAAEPAPASDLDLDEPRVPVIPENLIHYKDTPVKGREQAAKMAVEDDPLAPARGIRAWDQGRVGYRAAKRAFDIVFSGCAIVVLAVPAAVLSAAIRIESPGAPIYQQQRVGRLNEDGTHTTFTMYKFRSMVKDADDLLDDLKEHNEVAGPMFKMADDPRVTRIGRFIRRHSIDEFPQFVNVFLGQMSVVGPRPPLPAEVEEYDEWSYQRLAVKPGLTGPWQVGGRSDLDFEDMVRLDLGYIANRSFLNDLKYVVKTVAVLFKGEGAY